MMLSRALTFRCLLAVAGACLAWPAAVTAQTVASAPADSLAVSLELESTQLGAQDIERALVNELRVSVKVTSEPASKGLSIAVRGERVTVSFVNDAGQVTTRSVDLPKDRAQALEVIALLAGNLARDEAGELVASLKTIEPPPEPPAPPPVEASAREASPAIAPEPEKSDAPSPASEPKKEAAASAQPAEAPQKEEPAPLYERHSPFNLSLWHPITTLPHTERRVLHGELGLAYSYIGALRGAAATLGYLRIDQEQVGFSATVGWNRVDGRVTGMQTSSIATEGHGNLRGFESSGLLALRWANVEGAQVAGVYTLAEDVVGLQGSGVVATARDVTGLQASVVGVARDVEGLQAAVVTVGQDVLGLQASVVGVARDVKGLQASVTAFANEVDGAQVSVVNVAKRASVQVGVLNIADEVDVASIGVVSIAGNGRTQPFVMVGALPDLSVNAGVRFVAGYAFSQLSIGQELDQARFRTEGGLGFHYEVPGAFGLEAAALELGGHFSNTYQKERSFEGDPEGRVHYRLGLHLMVAKPAWLMGGVEVSHRVPVEGDPAFGGWLGASLF